MSDIEPSEHDPHPDFTAWLMVSHPEVRPNRWQRAWLAAVDDVDTTRVAVTAPRQAGVGAIATLWHEWRNALHDELGGEDDGHGSVHGATAAPAAVRVVRDLPRAAVLGRQEAKVDNLLGYEGAYARWGVGPGGERVAVFFPNGAVTVVGPGGEVVDSTRAPRDIVDGVAVEWAGASASQSAVFNDLAARYVRVLAVPLAGGEGVRRAHCQDASGQIVRYVEVARSGKVLRDDERPAKVYAPGTDGLAVQRGDDDWTWIPPLYGAGEVLDHVDGQTVYELADSARGPVYRRTADDVALWLMPIGDRAPQGPYVRTPDGWERS